MEPIPEERFKKMKTTILLLASAIALSSCSAIRDYQANYDRTYSVNYVDGERTIGGSVSLHPLPTNTKK